MVEGLIHVDLLQPTVMVRLVSVPLIPILTHHRDLRGKRKVYRLSHLYMVVRLTSLMLVVVVALPQLVLRVQLAITKALAFGKFQYSLLTPFARQTVCPTALHYMPALHALMTVTTVMVARIPRATSHRVGERRIGITVLPLLPLFFLVLTYKVLNQ